MERIDLAAVDISNLNGTFWRQQAWAIGLLGAFLLLIFLGLRLISWRKAKQRQARRGARTMSPRSETGEVPSGSTSLTQPSWSSLIGLDNRVSTSRTIAFLWTVVVAYCLLTLVLVATARVSTATPPPPGWIPPGWIEAALQPLAPAYLVALGAPFAAAVAAGVIVGQRTSNGDLQKSMNTSRPTALDVVTDDSGNLDLVDLQYTLFNAIAVVFVITQFVPHPARGMPTIPAAFAVLTGLSAAVYTSNKAAVRNPPVITQVLTPQVVAGGQVTVLGQNLVVDPDPSDPAVDARATLVSLASADQAAQSPAAFPADTATPTQVTFTTPPDVADGVWDIAITTNAGAMAVIYQKLSVRPAEVVARSTDGKAGTGGIGVDLADVRP
jgi:hypothetical protein